MLRMGLAIPLDPIPQALLHQVQLAGGFRDRNIAPSTIVVASSLNSGENDDVDS
jgi:hypothetical protein